MDVILVAVLLTGDEVFAPIPVIHLVMVDPHWVILRCFPNPLLAIHLLLLIDHKSHPIH